MELTSSEAIDYINLSEYMACVMEEFNKALNYKLHLKTQKPSSPDEQKEDEPLNSKLFLGRMTKRDLLKRLHTFMVRCLRKIRAYNFNDALNI